MSSRFAPSATATERKLREDVFRYYGTLAAFTEGASPWNAIYRFTSLGWRGLANMLWWRVIGVPRYLHSDLSVYVRAMVWKKRFYQKRLVVGHRVIGNKKRWMKRKMITFIYIVAHQEVLITFLDGNVIQKNPVPQFWALNINSIFMSRFYQFIIGFPSILGEILQNGPFFKATPTMVLNRPPMRWYSCHISPPIQS